MKRIFAGIFLVIAMFSCKSGDNDAKEITGQEKRDSDSLSKIAQRMKADSMKKKNPLLILPPDSQYTGDYTDKYSNGVIKFKGFFRFGQRHGQWLSFYPNGLLWSELNYEKGTRSGINTTYYINGKKRYEGYYKNDMQDSVWVYWDTAGVVAEKVLYKNDRIVKRLLTQKEK